MNYALVYERQATKDAKKLKGTPLADKAKELLKIVAKNPFADPPPFQSLIGDFKGNYSRRINLQHRLVYQVSHNQQAVKIIRLSTHYE